MNALRLGLRVASLREQGLCTCFCVVNLLRVCLLCVTLTHKAACRHERKTPTRVACEL